MLELVLATLSQKGLVEKVFVFFFLEPALVNTDKPISAFQNLR